MTPPLPLDPDPQALEAMMADLTRRVGQYVASLPGQPAQGAVEWQTVAERLREPIPMTASDPAPIYDFLLQEVVPCSFNTAGPGYLAYVPGGGLLSACAAEFLAAAVNRFTGLWAPAPAAVELETQVLRWLAEMMGMPAGTLGVFTSGGSMSSLLAVFAAREKKLGGDLAGARAYVSTEVHHCLPKALRLAGFPPDAIVRIPAGPDFRMPVDALRARIAADRAAGLRPFLVCGTAGTVNTGAVDPLAALADVAEAEGLWFHVDGAYGAPFRIVPALRAVFDGLERADSLVLDPHKGFFLPYGTGVLLVRDLGALRDAHGSLGAYLPPPPEGEEHLDFAALTPELSRDWRGLRLWLPFKLHGVAAFRDALAERRRLAVILADALRGRPGLVFAHEPELSLLAFRRCHPGVPEAEENRRNQELLARINAPRRVMITGTTIDGTFWLRLCVLHLRTDEARVREGLGIIAAALAET